MTKQDLELQKNKLIAETIAYSILINQHTEYCSFLRYSGHVDSFEIELAESKERYNNIIFQSDVRTAFSKYYEKNKNDVLITIKSYRDVMKNILETKEIPYDELTSHIEQNITYSF